MEEDKESERTKAYAQTLWDTALLESGFEIEAPKEFNSRIYTLLAQAYGLQGELELSEEEVKAAATEEVCPPPEHLDLAEACRMLGKTLNPAVCVGVDLSHASPSATLTPQECPICCPRHGRCPGPTTHTHTHAHRSKDAVVQQLGVTEHQLCTCYLQAQEEAAGEEQAEEEPAKDEL